MSELDLAFEVLREAYGSHIAVAKRLQISPQHYRHLRNSGVPVPPKTASYIILQAQAVQDSSACSASGEAGA